MKTRFGKLSIVGPSISKRIKGRSIRFVAVSCDCGILKEVRLGNLISGRTNSCGCLGSQKSGGRLRTHGQSSTLLYSKWCSMHNVAKATKCRIGKDTQSEESQSVLNGHLLRRLRKIWEKCHPLLTRWIESTMTLDIQKRIADGLQMRSNPTTKRQTCLLNMMEKRRPLLNGQEKNRFVVEP